MDSRSGVPNHSEASEHVSEIKQYTKRPVTVKAMQLVAYGDFTRAARWINENGGSAVFSPSEEDDYLIISTLEGNMEAHTGWWVIRGVKGEFYPCDAEIFSLSYEAVETAPYVESLTGTGAYVSGRPDGATSLTGGAAKALPN